MQEVEEQNIAIVEGHELSILVVSLLKNVIYSESPLWGHLLRMQARVRDYVSVLGLNLYLDEAEGYAFLRSPQVSEDDADSEAAIPRLMARRQLPFHTSLLLALLRKKLAEFDATGGGTRLILSRDEILELVRVFLPETTNDVKLAKSIDTHINKIAELGYLRKLKASSSRQDQFEVARILKAFVDGQWLSEFDERLARYQEHLRQTVGDSDDD
jgi:hypothetical protein